MIPPKPEAPREWDVVPSRNFCGEAGILVKEGNEILNTIRVIEKSALTAARAQVEHLVVALLDIKLAICPNHIAHPQSVWWIEHVQSIARKALVSIEKEK